jgi:hypothetical protein
VGRLFYQLTWKILPGLKGLSCSDFAASPTESPNNEQGVAFECRDQAECAALLGEWETHFAAERFTNNASAFETVKAHVLERTGRR